MRLKFIILSIVLIITIIFTSGCIFQQNHIFTEVNMLQPSEIANYTIITSYSPSFVQSLPEGAGTYHIYMSTVHRGDYPTYAGYTYKFNEVQSDKFGNYNKTYNYGWGFTTSPNSAGYLGTTDDNHIINTTFSIPDGVWNSQILINTKFKETTSQVKVLIERLE
jgi:hypothetical protein